MNALSKKRKRNKKARANFEVFFRNNDENEDLIVAD